MVAWPASFHLMIGARGKLGSEICQGASFPSAMIKAAGWRPCNICSCICHVRHVELMRNQAPTCEALTGAQVQALKELQGSKAEGDIITQLLAAPQRKVGHKADGCQHAQANLRYAQAVPQI